MVEDLSRAERDLLTSLQLPVYRPRQYPSLSELDGVQSPGTAPLRHHEPPARDPVSQDRGLHLQHPVPVQTPPAPLALLNQLME